MSNLPKHPITQDQHVPKPGILVLRKKDAWAATRHGLIRIRTNPEPAHESHPIYALWGCEPAAVERIRDFLKQQAIPYRALGPDAGLTHIKEREAFEREQRKDQRLRTGGNADAGKPGTDKPARLDPRRGLIP